MVITRQDALTYHSKFFSILFERCDGLFGHAWKATIVLPNGDIVGEKNNIDNSEVKTVRDQLILNTYIRLDV